MIGKIFGSLTILEPRLRYYERSDRPNGNGRTRQFWLVQCSCGTEPFELSDYKLQNGAQVCKSCSHSDGNNSKRIHGESDCIVRGKRSSATPEYRCWKAIKNRCYNPNWKQYKDYGGRGIRVCDKWLNSFVSFLRDMGRKPSNSHSIQRRDNDGGYCPENCYWATDYDQRRNRRTTMMLIYNGRTQCATDWANEIGVSKQTISRRQKCGWSDEEALFGRINPPPPPATKK